MTRTILVHLNVTLPENDDRTADQIADVIAEKAYPAILDIPNWKSIELVVALAEEV